MKKRKLRKWKMWMGYHEGKPDFDLDFDHDSRMGIRYGAVFRSRQQALWAYEEARPVEVRELK